MDRKLFFFSNSFPYGFHEQWKINELRILSNKFKIKIIPFSWFQDLTPPSTHIAEFCPPIRRKPLHLSASHLKTIVSSPRRFYYLRELILARPFSKAKFISYLMAVIYTEEILDSPEVNKIMVDCKDATTILYFYWATGSSLLVPHLKGNQKVVIRFHGFDLYEERNNNYIPFRKQILERTDLALFISEHGREYLHGKYPSAKPALFVSRLGVEDRGDSIPSSDSRLRIITCSRIIELKRLDLIVRALHHIEFEVLWTHIGDGEKQIKDQLNQLIETLPPNIEVKLVGHIESHSVMNFYVDQEVDLFLNVSTTEGVPVSIMEALSAAIPIMATNVGGTSEIVDNQVGHLINHDISERELADFITDFYFKPSSHKKRLRFNAKQRFKEKCLSEVHAETLLKKLTTI